MSDVTSISITTPGQLDRLGRKFVCERAVGTTVTHLDEGIATGSCSTAEIGTQYEQQKLTNDAIQRICASKKMAKFLKSVVPIRPTKGCTAEWTVHTARGQNPRRAVRKTDGLSH
ncbi:hypothetical protein Ddc_16078 [Ditylenchus destructor]|nr:hypothetical protein Ddc_16078 [Ditylenchus destructor]